MVFSSFEFLFIFLPVFFAGYFLIKPSTRNFYLFLLSFLFYYVGEPKRSWILLAYILVNYCFALGINFSQKKESRYTKFVLGIGILLNLLLLIYFKYIGFISENIYSLLSFFNLEALVSVIQVALPLGISFITFQGISYLMDVYRGEVKASKNLIVICSYISMFPHLVAGPIVRYKQVEEELNHNRDISSNDFVQGIFRFCRGLIQKVVFADTLAACADGVFSLPAKEITFGLAWLGALAYSLQIYFDFSGYSSMAIGLARMMGFHFPENFNFPYKSKSIQEFWRRWHMTLSFWFRDYVYIALGGNRNGTGKTYRNLFIVFLLTGLWHGAAWTFVIWGLWHGLFLIAERIGNSKYEKIWWPFKYIYTLLVVIFGWVIFRSENLDQAMFFMGHMVGQYGVSLEGITEFTNPIFLTVFILGVVISLGVLLRFEKYKHHFIFKAIVLFIGLVLMLFVGLKILAGSYSPFLYFRF